ncbi:hypothetical protein BG20_I1629 [Candidatus Nitrosarchaeum limnium BG20]|uniref:Uncharacterized protein n=2 Tax=Nitrosarchaeum TaxID=1007082 RepID=S2E4N0_9ARCH|nr:hypothetical protein BG20_I1629 [Candidatus Nitrosarchaeum limnium BG20]
MRFDLKDKVILGMILVLALSLMVNQAFAESPRKQMDRGIAAEDVTCKEGHSLVIRNNGYPICVKSVTAQKLEKRGLGVIIAKEDKIDQTPSTEIPIKDLEKTQTNTYNKTPQSSGNIREVPADAGSVINFYITDEDLNLAHNGVDVVSTQGLFEFSINGVSISGPSTITETGPNTGQFFVKLQLPDTINGRALNQNDVVLIKYLDASDSTGSNQTITKSIPLTKSYAAVETSGDSSRIGRVFTVRIYEPDANLDSQDNDRIPLSKLEYRGKGGIRTTLSNSAFDANSSYLIETGPNTNIFEVKIKIPRYIDGKLVDIGDWYEIRYIDSSTPSGTDEKVVLQGRIG